MCTSSKLPTILTPLPLGSILPQGWLLRQLELQANGLTGQLGDIWEDVGNNSAWLGGTGEDWERGPYYLDGLLPLAYLLANEALIGKVNQWVESILASQQENGQFGPQTNDDWWPRMVACKVLIQHAEVTNDSRVLPFLLRYFAYQSKYLPSRPLESWGKARGAEAVLPILWAYTQDPSSELLDLAELLLDQTDDWHQHLTQDLSPFPTKTFSHLNHGPNVAMGLKTTAVAAQVNALRTANANPYSEALKESRAEIDRLESLHGLVHGIFSGDEWIAGREPHHGVETCQVVEYMYSMENLTCIYGKSDFADRLELAAFNLLPAAFDPQMLAHQYHQQANQVLVSVEQRGWSYSGDDANIFGLEPNFGCCTANYHQGWPKYAASLWAATSDGGLAAISYSPCSVNTELPAGTFKMNIETNYPFDTEVRIDIVQAPSQSVPLKLRLPQWCEDPSVSLNDEQIISDQVDDFLVIERQWEAGDTLVLSLPARPRLIERDRGAVGVRLGPLVMVFCPGENWVPVPGAPGLAEWTVSPRRGWNYGLVVTESDKQQYDQTGRPRATKPEKWTVERREPGAVPFSLESVPVIIRVSGSRLPDWNLVNGSAGPVPSSPVAEELPIEDIPLVPYGSARIRIAEFPVAIPNATSISFA